MENFLNSSGDNDFSTAFIDCVDFIIKEAIIQQASDIHFEPEDNFLRLRYRKDGVLQEKCKIPIKFWQGISIRLKVMANISSAKSLTPKDGRFFYKFCQSKVDIRLSSVPVVEGENIVLRILDNKQHFINFSNLGLNPSIKSSIEGAQKHSDGLFFNCRTNRIWQNHHFILDDFRTKFH